MANDAVQKKPGFIQKVKRFFRDSKGELKKIVWPEKKQIVNNTTIVICVVAISAVFVGGFDSIVTGLLRLFVKML